ncbi:hypothetical protein CEXT_644221 [Caerostris extrusa]|uniref:Uncharacterized protein n=1 Tax=Caerostris extrusa TaxID=172846 RepID=A0AAV4RT51_CAEEX|nr:hypothetical protein CEXT_644221 [Caerostris extrusa]
MVMCVRTSLPRGRKGWGGGAEFSSHANAGRSLLEDVSECRDIDFRCYQRCKISAGFICIRVGTWNCSDAKDSQKKGVAQMEIFILTVFLASFQER